MSHITNDQFVECIQTYKTNMYRLALTILHNEADAQDAVSESIMKAYAGRASLRDNTKFKSWIMQIVVNEARKSYRKSKKMDYVEDVEGLQLFHQDEYHELWDVIMKLELMHREVIILYFYEQLQIKEISKILHIAEGTVKSRLFRAKKLLKQML